MKKIIILGAAGRDFHDFLTVFKKDSNARVVCFTGEQIPGIVDRRFPAILAGKRYPRGIPIHPEAELEKLITKHKVDEVVLSYSDLKHVDVMHKASRALAAGADFRLLSYATTRLESKRPVISVCAVRTGAGKSQVSRKIVTLLRAAGKKVAVIRHPMPYGDLAKEAVQRFGNFSDLDKAKCTIEEREEYEPHLRNGAVVFAGVDYAKILKLAEKEAEIIVWDGGNNDVPFLRSDLQFVVLDPLRAGDELTYHPGEENFRLADVLVINKMNSATKAQVKVLLDDIKTLPTQPTVIRADSKISAQTKAPLKGKRALVIEDGPTLTHGGMSYGAGTVYAKKKGCRLIDPRKFAVGSLKTVYEKFTQLGNLLPAMGYSDRQVKEIQQTIKKSGCDVVINGSPIDLSHLVQVPMPIIDVHYDLAERGKPDLATVLKKRRFL